MSDFSDWGALNPLPALKMDFEFEKSEKIKQVK